MLSLFSLETKYRNSLRSGLLRYFSVVAIVIIATLAHLPFNTALGGKGYFVTLYPAIVYSAWIASVRGGLFATILCALLATWFIIPPIGSLIVHNPADQLALILFILGSITISILGQAQKHAQARANGAEAALSAERTAAILRESEASKETVLESISDAFFTLDHEWCFTFTNAQAERLLQKKRGELLGQFVWKEFPDAVGGTSYQEYHRAMSDGITVAFEEFYPPLNTWFEVRAYPSSEGLSVYFHDITERKQAEEKISENQRRLAGVVESAMDGIITIDGDGQIILFNRASEKMFGYSASQMLGQSLNCLLPERYRSAHMGHIMAFGQTGVSSRRMGALGSISGLRSNGEEFPVEASISQVTVKDNTFFTVILRDISERKQQQEAQLWIAAIVNSSNDAIIGKTLDGIITSWNPGAEKVFGYSSTEVIGQSILMLFPPERVDEEKELLTQIERGENVAHFETVRVRKDGKRIDVSVTLSPIINPDGKIIGASKIARDNTDQKQANESLQRQAELLEQSYDAIFVWELGGGISYWNRGAELLYGFSKAEAKGRVTHELFQTERRISSHQFEEELKQAGRWEGELRHTTKDGRRIVVESRHIITRQKDGRVDVMETNRDITKQQEAQETLAKSQERLRLALEVGHLGTYHLELATGRYLDSSDVFKAHLGFAPEDEISQADIILRRHPDDSDRVTADLRLAWANHQDLRAEYRYFWPDGSLHWIASSGRPVYSEPGEAFSIIGVTQDITKRKQAEEELHKSHERLVESERRLQLALESGRLGSFELDDATGQFLAISDTYKAQFGLPPDAPFSLSTLVGMFHPDDRDRILEVVGAAKAESGGWQIEHRVVWPDGSIHWLSAYAARFPDATGHRPRLVGIIQDITERKQAEKALLESQAVYRALVDQMPAGVFRKDAEGRYVFVNSFFCGLRNTTPERFLGKLPRELPSEESSFIEQAASHHAQIMQTGQSIEVLDEYHRPDGKTLYFHVVKSPVFDAEGKIIGSQGVLFDVTANKEAEEALRESEKRFQTLANSMPQLAWIARPDGFIFWYNQRWYEYTGTTQEQMEGWGWQRVHDPQTLPLVMERWTGAIAAGQEFEMEFPLRGADGRFRRFLTQAQPLKNAEGSVVQWFGTNTDVDEIKRAEDEIRRLATELEQRVIERTTQLEAANKELESFSYSVSHDLRAPLRGIDGFSQALLEDYADSLDATGKSYLNRVRAASQRMSVLIDDMLGLSRVSRADLRRQPVDLSAVARSVLEGLAEGQPERTVTVVIAPGLQAEADPRLMRVLMDNLLGNAWKYTSKHATALIEFGRTEHEGKSCFFVRDDGAGFDMAYADKLFSAFQRLHTTGEFEGTGIGLATVQRILNRHGGQVWAEAAVEQGTTFYFMV